MLERLGQIPQSIQTQNIYLNSLRVTAVPEAELITEETPNPDLDAIPATPPASYPVGRNYGVSVTYAQAFKNQGIETVDDVAAIQQIDLYEEPLGIPSKILHRISLRAKSIISGQIIQTETVEFPRNQLIYIDIETDEKCSKVWLIGLLVDGRFTQLNADSWQDEKRILEELLSFLGTHRGYIFVSYSGTGFDIRVTLNAMKSWA